MAKRPVYIPISDSEYPGVIIEEIDFEWHPGMSVSQKQKSINSLHNSANEKGIFPILEISSKSENEIGVKLSAFNLMITTPKGKTYSVETAFQSSKVFTGSGGPFPEILEMTSREAKQAIKEKEIGNLIKFKFYDKEFPIKPRTFFYDWIYIKALIQNKDLSEKISDFNGFTDIEFNPKKSINCQAYSAALFVSLDKTKKLKNAIENPESFLKVNEKEYKNKDSKILVQSKLLL